MIEGLARAIHMNPITFYSLLFGTLIIGSMVLGFVLNRGLHHWGRRLHDGWGQLLFSLLETLPIPLLLIASLYLGLESLPLPDRFERVGSKLIFALAVLVMIYFPAQVIVLALRRAGQQDPHLLRVTQPAAFVIRTLFALIGTIIFLENMGVTLTAVWTTLGVGSVAVALALQETLSNFFSGLYLMADRPVNPNDYIKLDSGAEGYVLQIGWRSTVLRTLGNNHIVIPNSTFAKATITNYSSPETPMSYSLPVSVVYGTDPQQVEKALLEVGREALRDRLPGLLSQPAPSVQFIPGFGTASLDFSLGVQIGQFTDQYSVQSELRKRVVRKFKEAGIEMPTTLRTRATDKPARDPASSGSKS
ncbi:MAG: mechanosensitive ion channel family protein [Terriglobia bacterium]